MNFLTYSKFNISMTSENDIEKYFKPSLIPPTIKSKCHLKNNFIFSPYK